MWQLEIENVEESLEKYENNMRNVLKLQKMKMMLNIFLQIAWIL